MLEHDDDLTPASDTARRTVLRRALVLGAGSAPDACGGSSSDNTAAPPAGTDTGSTPPPTESTPSPSASAKAKKSAKPSAAASATTKPKGTELGPVSDIKVGGCKIYSKLKVVVTQPTAGKFFAFSSICTHQECELIDCEGGKLNCPCHASTFDMSTGAPDSPPATVALPKKKVTVAGGSVYLT